jgi:hypothetical protein
MLSDAIPSSIPLMQNTDGLEMMIPAHMRDVYLDTCKRWEEMTLLQLEHDEYEKMIIGDVNNYVAVLKAKEVNYEEYESLKKKTPHYVYTMKDGKYYYNATKCKGRFEFSDLALHKNKSALIVAKAIYNYFVKDVVPEKFIQENRNILDYCKGVKKKGDWFFLQTCFVKGQRINTELQAVVRYYISNNGCKIIKVNSADGREIQVEAGKWMQTEFNQYENKPWPEYDVNEDYYLEQIYKEIENISKTKENSQLSLF